MQQNVFARDLAVNRKDSNTYTAQIGKTQRFGEFVHGGFSASLIVHTALEHARTTLEKPTEQHISSLHVEFLKPVDRNELELYVQHLRVGKAISTLHITINQRGKPVVTGDVTLVAPSANRGISLETDFKLSPPPISANLSQLSQNTDPGWTCYHLPHNETSQGLPLAHWNLYFMASGPVHPRLHDHWFSLFDPNARITTVLLPVIADMYLRMVDNYVPDSDFNYDACVRRAKRSVNGSVRQEDLDAATMASWTATQSLKLEIVRQLPPEGVKWIFLRAEGKVIRDGRLVAELTMLDEGMEVVAIGQGTDIIVPAQKWVDESRRTGTGAKMMKM